MNQTATCPPFENTAAPLQNLARSVGPGHRNAMAWILVVAFVIRLVLWLWFWNLPIRIFDEKDYDILARNLVAHGEYAFQPGIPTSLRPPLYPTLVAAVYGAFGSGNLVVLRLLQAVLSLVLVVMLYRLGSEVGSPGAGLVAAGLMAFYPSFLGYNNLLLTEILFTTFLVAGSYVLLRGVRTASLGWLGFAGLLFGFGALTRSTLWPSFLPFGLWLVAAWRGPLRGRGVALAVYLAAFVLVLAPWTIRNTRLERTFQTVDSMGGRNLMIGNYEYTPLYRSWAAIGLEGERNWFTVLRKARPEVAGTTQGQRDKIALRYGVDFARHHPGLTLKRDVVKFLDFWGLERELIAGAADGYFGPIPRWALVPLTLAIFGTYAVVLFLGIFGLAAGWTGDWRPHAFLVLAMALICGLHTLTFGHSRYHLPLMPIMMVYASLAVVHRREIWSRRGRPAFLLACSLCALFVIGWGVGLIGPDYDRFMNLLGRQA